MKELKEYQLKAIEELKYETNRCFKGNKNDIIVFQAPTGSGKTITMARFIKEFAEESSDDLCFLWVSIGKGELQLQSKESVNKEIGESMECSLLEQEFFGTRKNINQNEIVFVNWEKIRTKDKTTNEYKNVLMKDSEQINFPEVLKNTHNIGRKIILIIDESHYAASSDRAIELRNEIIEPDFTIEMSATPILTGDSKAKISVDPEDVIMEGMIKKEVIINEGIAEKIESEEDEKTSEQFVLEAAYSKQLELKERYKNAYLNHESNVMITPLTIIQLPNSSYGEAKKEVVEKFLENKDITISNGKLAVWLADEKINESKDKLNILNSNVEFLIFKTAIDTGWDCPRAQILLKFRETNSITFELQTVGRILRMPEAKHYSDSVLNTAYVYSNIQSISIKKEVYNPNIIKTDKSISPEKFNPVYKVINTIKNNVEDVNITLDDISKENDNKKTVKLEQIIISSENNAEEIEKTNTINNSVSISNLDDKEIETFNTNKNMFIVLKSYYKKRKDFGDITSSFYNVFESQFCNYFQIEKVEYIQKANTYEENINKLKAKGVTFGVRKTEKIISDANINSEEIDTEINIDDLSKVVDIIMSDSDLQYDFDKIIKNNLNGFAPVRSIPTVRKAIYQTFAKYLNISLKSKGMILIQNVIVNNEEIFNCILNIATEKYIPVHDAEVEVKEEDFYDDNWMIPENKYYNPQTFKEVDSKLSYYQPLRMELIDGKINKLELAFVNYLDKHEKYIEYFWKNGSEHMSSNFGIKTKTVGTFQPDFLIMFKNGMIGIFDTKAKDYNEDDNREKSQALQQYIVDENKRGRNLVGGLVIEEKGEFYYFDRNVYNKYSVAPDEWKKFDDFFKD